MGLELEARILRLIDEAGGWMPFDRFMAEALYAPGLGYYAGGRQTFGLDPRGGSDFVTAPELSPLFGRCVARQVAQALELTGTRTVLEFGAGSGALAEQLLDGLLANGAHPDLRYLILDLSGSLRARQQARLARFGDRVQWIEALPDQLEAVLVGNEVLDAMPVQLLHFDGQRWSERGVAASGDDNAPFCWRDRPSDLRPPYEQGGWVPDTQTELHAQASAWIRSVAERLRRGALLLIDYGFGEAEYYHPQRRGGTLMCHQLHRADPDPLQQVGEKDITAHVNFTAIALAGQEAGLEVLGYTSQAHFLLNCGIAELLVEATLPQRAMAQKLLTEHEMGELFKVIAFAPVGQAFEALGFSRGDRTHRL